MQKLILFGASSKFVICLANLYALSGDIIYCNGTNVMYMLHSGIKQGLPLSPYLFLFYIDDIFNYFDGIFVNPRSDVFENLHILIHADDANMISSSRDLLIIKLNSLLRYCHINGIILQPSKLLFYCNKWFS